MKRKLIELGHECMVVSLPIKWVRQNSLSKGNEIEVEPDEGRLIITSNTLPQKKEIAISIGSAEETAARMMLVNAYRLGFDKITIMDAKENPDIHTIVEDHMLGFILTKTENGFVAESITEPAGEAFYPLLSKQFLIILDMLRQMPEKGIADIAKTVQKHDNFLKRCISKNLMTTNSNTNYWQLTSSLTRISRHCMYLNNLMKKSEKTSTKEFLQKATDMLALLKKAYESKQAETLLQIHSLKKEVFSMQDTNMPQMQHYHCLAIIDAIYYATSPLFATISKPQT